MTTRIQNCEIEIDHDRGVIYVHGIGKLGVTLIRISQLPKGIPNPVEDGMLDISLCCCEAAGASWAKPVVQ